MKKLKSKKYNLVIIFVSLNVCDDKYVLKYRSDINDKVEELEYDSLKEFNEYWEEDLSNTGLICGKEHIEIFKAWAKYTGDTAFLYDKEKDCLIANFSDQDRYKLYFSFTAMNATKNLINNTVYSLNELIGEDENRS